MALKFQIDKLEEVGPSLREHYTAKDGKFQLQTEGDNRVAEFRDNNVALTKKLAAFEGIDPEEYKALKAKAASGDLADVAALRAELATEKAARATAQGIADASVLKSVITDKFIKAGGRGNALDFIITKASPLFDVVNGALVGKTFDPDKPGEKLTPEGFINLQLRESDFAFKPSSGGGANPKPGGSSGGGAGNVIRNPTPQQLGEHAADVKSGKVRFEYDN